jgi:hypothetical protein
VRRCARADGRRTARSGGVCARCPIRPAGSHGLDHAASRQCRKLRKNAFTRSLDDGGIRGVVDLDGNACTVRGDDALQLA